MLKKMKDGENPRDSKLILAETIAKMFHGPQKALKAKESFISQFSEGNVPDDTPQISLNSKTNILEFLKKSGLVKSNAEGKRKLNEGAVVVDGQKISDTNYELVSGSVEYVKLGKKIIKIK